ncbi:MAG: hypothetical protein K0Q51_1232 [Rickettsiaceae bacterium]|jgi:type IV secretion system protein VirB6|nr:hypothetical protein [Rickettsiaceae bacterium]
MSNNKKKPNQLNRQQKTLIGLVIFASVFVLIYGMIGMISTYKASNGCLLRYADTSSLNRTRKSVDMIEFELRANANYKTKRFTDVQTNTQGNTTTVTRYGPDPDAYGKWLRVDTVISEVQEVSIEVEGEISLCRAYLPANNLQSNSNLKNGQKIPIPRTFEAESLPLILDAKNSQWRNVLEVDQLDKIEIYLGVNKTGSSVAKTDIFASTPPAPVNCSEGQKTYDPACGRYSPFPDAGSAGYPNGYLQRCDMSQCGDTRLKCVWYHDLEKTNPNGKEKLYPCAQRTDADNLEVPISAIFGDVPYCHAMGTKVFAPRPAYSAATKAARSTDPESLLAFRTKYDSSWSCLDNDNSNPKDYTIINDPNDYQKKMGVWFTGDDAAGLVYRKSDNGEVSNITDGLGAGEQFSNAPDLETGSTDYKLILEETSINGSKYFLQYALQRANFLDASHATGGYVLYLKQTKCRREGGAALTDSFQERGRVEYLLLPGHDNDPNTDPSLGSGAMPIDFGSGAFNLPSGSKGYLWLKIKNHPDDYKDSFGHYQTKVIIKTPVAGGGISLFTKLFEMCKRKIMGLSQTFLKNMTCYGSDPSRCTNYFTFIRAILALYIITTAMMFLIGMIEINQKQLVIIAVKVGIVSGLINEKTYEFLNDYFIPLIMGAGDTIIGNLDSIALFAQTTIIDDTRVVNPFTFVDELFARIFLDPTFTGQLVALLSFGAHGIGYFIIIMVTLIITVTAIFRAVSVYILAFVAQCLLLNLAPIFLTFMLFDYTKELFEKWLKYFIRYAIEPLILIVGLIIFVQLFTVYLDYAINYSVCWKCALSFAIPNVIPGFQELAMSKVPLFCINWFVPWGQDSAGFPLLGGPLIGLNFTNIVALMIIAYGMRGYIDIAQSMTAQITGVYAPGMGDAAKKMTSAVGQAALKQISLDKKTRDRIVENIKKGRDLNYKEDFVTKKLKAASKKLGIDKIINSIKSFTK